MSKLFHTKYAAFSRIVPSDPIDRELRETIQLCVLAKKLDGIKGAGQITWRMAALHGYRAAAETAVIRGAREMQNSGNSLVRHGLIWSTFEAIIVKHGVAVFSEEAVLAAKKSLIRWLAQ